MDIKKLNETIGGVETSFYPLTHEDAVVDNNGTTIASKIDDLETKYTASYDAMVNAQEVVDNLNANTYRKSETYNKTELNSMITTPEVNYVNVEATDQTTDISDVLPATGANDTIYKVGNWDGTQYDTSKYTEYTWNGSAYVFLATRDHGIDDEPTAESDNLVKSAGVANALRIAKGVQNAYLKEDGTVATISYNAFQVTDYIAIPNIKDIYIYKSHPAGSANRTYIAFYDKDKKFISVIKDTSSENYISVSLKDVTIPSGAAYFMVTLAADGFVMATNLDAIYPSLNEVNFMKEHLLNGIYVKSNEHNDIAGAFKYIQIKTNTIKDLTVQRFHHDDSIIFYEWNNNVGSQYLRLGLEDGVAIGNYLLFSGSDYLIIVDLYYTENEIGTATKTDIELLSNCFDIVKGSVESSDNINPITGKAVSDYVHGEIDGVSVIPHKAIKKVDGNIVIVDTPYSYGVSELLTLNFVKDGKIWVKKEGGLLIFAAIFNKNRQPIGVLVGTESGGRMQYDLSNLSTDIAALQLQETPYYVRFNIDPDNDYPDRMPINYLSESSAKLQGEFSPYWSNEDIYDYNKVLTMPKDVVKSMVETASLGQCTALYDNDGYPSLMYKVNPISIGALSPVNGNSEAILGDYETIHPAFVVDGVTKNLIYIAVFMTSEVIDTNNNKHYVSWFGLPPVASLGRNTLRTAFAAKGNGWHLETVYESSLLSMLAAKFNSPTIRGNSNKGRCYDAGYEHECVRMYNNGLPGPETQVAGAKWINGTQPSAWSHNGEKWGIQDVVGGYHEIIDLVNLDYGKVILADDNKFFTSNDDVSTFENGWSDTGAAVDRKNSTDNDHWFSNAVTIQDNPTNMYYNTWYQNYECSPAYDSLSLAVRKKLAMLFIVPRLSSQDTAPVFACRGMMGDFNNKANLHFVVRKAEEYQEQVGLGGNVVGYNTDAENGAHNNMGSRLVCIQ